MFLDRGAMDDGSNVNGNMSNKWGSPRRSTISHSRSSGMALPHLSQCLTYASSISLGGSGTAVNTIAVAEQLVKRAEK